MNKQIEDFIKCKNIAVVGVSRDPKKFGTYVYKELLGRGYQVFAVNPSMNSIDGQPCYPDLAALKGKVDGVVINVPPGKAAAVVRQAAEAGIANIWIQQGAQSPEVLKTAEELGLSPVLNKCILMYAPPIKSFHKIHYFFARLFGQY